MNQAKPRNPKRRIETELKRIAFAAGPVYSEVKPKDSLKALEMLCRINGLWGEPRDKPAEGQLGALLDGLNEPENPEEEREDDL